MKLPECVFKVILQSRTCDDNRQQTPFAGNSNPVFHRTAKIYSTCRPETSLNTLDMRGGGDKAIDSIDSNDSALSNYTALCMVSTGVHPQTILRNNHYMPQFEHSHQPDWKFVHDDNFNGLSFSTLEPTEY